MRFKLVKTGKCYAERQGEPMTLEALVVTAPQEEAFGTRAEVVSQVLGESPVLLPVIWETGNIDQIRSLLVLREAELVAAKAQLTGDPMQDWYVRNRIGFLEPIVVDLKEWLADAMGKGNRS